MRVSIDKKYRIRDWFTLSKPSHRNEGAFGSKAIDSGATFSTYLEQVEEKYSNVEEWTRKLRKKYLRERHFAQVLRGAVK